MEDNQVGEGAYFRKYNSIPSYEMVYSSRLLRFPYELLGLIRRKMDQNVDTFFVRNGEDHGFRFCTLSFGDQIGEPLKLISQDRMVVPAQMRETLALTSGTSATFIYPRASRREIEVWNSQDLKKYFSKMDVEIDRFMREVIFERLKGTQKF